MIHYKYAKQYFCIQQGQKDPAMRSTDLGKAVRGVVVYRVLETLFTLKYSKACKLPTYTGKGNMCVLCYIETEFAKMYTLA